MTRRAADLLLGARLTLAGGRAGVARTATTALGVALGVAALLIAASIPSMYDQRQARNEARLSVEQRAPAPSGGTVLVAEANTEFRDRDISGRLLQGEGPDAPMPPGLERLPRPGEVFVSPALRRLLASPEGALLRPRIPGRIAGDVAPAGLLGPHELGFYAGSDRLTEDNAHRIDRFGNPGASGGLDPVLAMLVVIMLAALLIPVGVLVGTAVRTGGEDRDRRLAAVRLIGADRGMARRIAAGEALVSAAAGLLLGLAVFLAARSQTERIELSEYSVFAADVRPSTVLAVLVVLGVPAAALAVTLLALRGVVAEPLGVVRRATESRRRVLWRLVLPAVGLGLLLLPGAKDSELRIAFGIVALLLGVASLLPWVVERVVARLDGGGVAWQLATRRLQLDPGGAARAVSGIAVAVAGAIALQMVFAASREEFERDTGHDTSRAQAYATFHGDPSRLAGLQTAPGVLRARTVASYPIGSSGQLLVADCAALRELAVITRCADGDSFRVDNPAGAGRRVALVPAVEWRVPASAQVVRARPDPTGSMLGGILATPRAVAGTRLPTAKLTAYLSLDPRDPDAIERVRNAAVEISPLVQVQPVHRRLSDRQYAAIERALLAGATLVLLLIGASLLVSSLEQVRERRRALAVLVAVGARRRTLGLSVLWQSAVPVGLGMAVALATGVGLGALLLRILELPVEIAWASVLAMAAVGGAIVLLVTVGSLPALWRTTRADGLRNE